MRSELLTLLSIKGFAKADGLAESIAADRSDVDAALAELAANGWADEAKIGWRLTPAGKEAARESADAERHAFRRETIEDAYASFTISNDRFKATIARWQMRDVAGASVPNDHTDAAYDATVVDDIRAIHAEIVPLIDRLAATVPRIEKYRGRFERALERIGGGERRFVAAPIVDSYHTVWFEFHEDLIRLSGRNRHDEAAAGRGA